MGEALQSVTAARLGRAFLPLAAVALLGVIRLGAVSLADPRGWGLLAGAALTAGEMLAFGLRNVQLAFGRALRPWMTAAMAGSVVPPVFALYVFGWSGLRGLARAQGPAAGLEAVVLTGAGLWIMRGWMKVVEVQRLARAMEGIGAEEGPL